MNNSGGSAKAIGLYLHIPFCGKKCAYCDFFSGVYNEQRFSDYVNSLLLQIKKWGGRIDRPIDTLYIGGGTPSLLMERLIPVIDAVNSSFYVLENAEITIEINPSENAGKLLSIAKKAGVNRVSIGAQCADDETLKILGRAHTVSDTKNAVAAARAQGFSNISLDLMIALPFSNAETLKRDAEFICSLAPEHISAYMLSIEENTVFSRDQHSLDIPSEENAAQQYLLMCEILKASGYRHYEISNFSKKGFESRHNLKYWRCEEYLGIGPAAHSFLSGERFYYPRNMKAFIDLNEPEPDGSGGGREEYIMLRLRLFEGISFEDYKKRFSQEFPERVLLKCRRPEFSKYFIIDEKRIAISEQGMLISNRLITEILEEL